METDYRSSRQLTITVRPRLISGDYSRLSPSRVRKELNPHFGDNFVCQICKNVLFAEPRECRTCKNAFCQACIAKWIAKGNGCPFKCTADIVPLHRVLVDQLQKLRVECIN